jgi:hypothetical protein
MFLMRTSIIQVTSEPPRSSPDSEADTAFIGAAER